MTDPARQPSRVNAIADAFWEETLRLSPATATVYGDDRYGDRLDDPGPDGRAAARAVMEGVRRDVADVPDEGLTDEDRITRDVLAHRRGHRDRERRPLASTSSRQSTRSTGPRPSSSSSPSSSPPTRPSTSTRGSRASAHTARTSTPTSTSWPTACARGGPPPGSWPSGRSSSLAAPRDPARPGTRARDVEGHRTTRIASGSGPSSARSSTLPTGDSSPRCRAPIFRATREQPGSVSAPDGEALYRHAIRRWTSLDLDPRDVHQVGLDELASIDDERRAIARDAGFGDDTRAYRAAFAADPANHAAVRRGAR